MRNFNGPDWITIVCQEKRQKVWVWWMGWRGLFFHFLHQQSALICFNQARDRSHRNLTVEQPPTQHDVTDPDGLFTVRSGPDYLCDKIIISFMIISDSFLWSLYGYYVQQYLLYWCSVSINKYQLNIYSFLRTSWVICELGICKENKNALTVADNCIT